MWKNLGDAVEKTVIAHRACLPEPADAPTAETEVADTAPPVPVEPHTPIAAGEPAVPGRLETRYRERYEQIHALRAEGKGMRTIGSELGLDRKTVRRFCQADSVEQLLTKTTSRATLLDEHQAHLHQRWNEGCTNFPRLVDELRSQGYRGSARTVYRHLQPIRTRQKAPDPTPAPPKVRDVTCWIMRDPANLDPNKNSSSKQCWPAAPNLMPPAATSGPSRT